MSNYLMLTSSVDGHTDLYAAGRPATKHYGVYETRC